ncbi:uncharacterized protein [Panulirus ornatus]|uniref:uncharacterized protein n=1 Tax=Panulirus ornatus TaxID=150431 RepID=UPI003A86B314
MNVPSGVSTAGLTFLSQAGVGPLTRGDENALKYFVMLRRTGPVGTSLAKVCRELYDGGQRNVKDYIQSLGFSNNKYRKIFTADELDALEAGTDWDQLDITFLYKLLQHVCRLAPPHDRKWARPEPHDRDCLEHILFSVKCERNFLFHEALGLTDSDLDARAQKLKSLLAKAFEKASIITGYDYTHDITEMKLRVDDIHQSRTKLSVQDYQNELQEFRHRLLKEVISDSQRELCQSYQRLWQADHVCWQFNPSSRRVPFDNVYTNITLLTRKDSELTVSDLLDYQLPNGSLPRLVILEGSAGAGKSQLCKYILHCWATGNSTSTALLNVDIIIFFQCHSVTSNSLREFFTEEILKATCKGLRHEDVIPTLRESRISFIIDGLDEAGKQAMNLLKDISVKFPASRVVVTCRPEFTKEAKRIISPIDNDFIILNVKGFSRPQQIEYIDKLLTVMEGDASECQEKIKTLSTILQDLEHGLHYLLCLPLTLTMLIELWLQDGALLTTTGTLTHVLQKLVELSIILLAQRLQRRPEETRPIFVLEHACREWLKCLARVAWDSHCRNVLVLNEEWIDDLIEEACRREIDPSYALSSFLKHMTREVTFGIQDIWEFSHKVYQDYLSAFHLSQEKKLRSFEPHRSKESNDTFNFRAESEDSSPETKRHTKEHPCFPYAFLRCCLSAGKHKNRPLRPSSASRRLPKSLPRSFRSREYAETNGIRESSFLKPIWRDVRDRHISTNTTYRREVAARADHYMLQYLAALNLSKQEPDVREIVAIVKDFNESIMDDIWSSWSNLIRECAEHDLLSSIVRPYLEDINVELNGKFDKINQTLRTVQYLMQTTRFVPKSLSLWISDDDVFPEALPSLLLSLEKLSVSTDFKCSLTHCLDLYHCLTQQEALQYLAITIYASNFVELNGLKLLLQYLHGSDCNVKLGISIDNLQNMMNLAECFSVISLPRKTELCLSFSCVRLAMLEPLCQVFQAFPQHASLTVTFNHNNFGDLSVQLQELVTQALTDARVKVAGVWLKMEADAMSTSDHYNESAGIMTGDTPNVSFHHDNSGDNVNLRLLRRKENVVLATDNN